MTDTTNGPGSSGADTKTTSPRPEHTMQERWYQRLKNWLWGYDFFISYHWASGGTYAVNLAARLREKGYEVFLDRAEYAMGDKWKGVGEVALRNTQRLVLIATREAVFESKPVEHEVVKFTDRGRHCIPIFFGDTFAAEEAANRGEFIVLDRLPDDTLYIEEAIENLPVGPATEVVEKLASAHGIMRRRKLRQTITSVALSLLVAFSVFAGVSWVDAWFSRIAAERSALVAQQENVRLLVSQGSQQQRQGRPNSAMHYYARAIERMEAIDEDALGYRVQLGHMTRCVPQLRAVLPAVRDPTGIVVSPSEDRILVLNKHSVLLANAADGTPIATINGRDAVEALNVPSPLRADSGVEMTGKSRAELNSASFSPDGRALVTLFKFHRHVVIWDAVGGKPRFTLRGHTNSIAKVKYSPDGSLIVTTGFDDTCRVWNARSGQLLNVLRGHTAPVEDAVFSPDQSRLVTRSRDNTARIWDWRDGKESITLRGHKDGVAHVALSEDGSRILSSPGSGSLSQKDSTIRVWDAMTGEAILNFDCLYPDWIEAQFSGSGERIISACHNLFVGTTAEIWDAKTGNRLAEIERLAARPEFNLDRDRVLVVSKDGYAQIWNLERAVPEVFLQGAVGFGRFAANGHLVITGFHDGTVRAWDARNGEEIAQLDGFRGQLIDAAFSPETRLLAAVDLTGIARVWNMTALPLATMIGHHAPVTRLRISTDGTRILSASRDGTVRIWETRHGRQIASIEEPGFIRDADESSEPGFWFGAQLGRTRWRNDAWFSPSARRIYITKLAPWDPADSDAILRHQLVCRNAETGTEIVSLNARWARPTDDGTRLVVDEYDRISIRDADSTAPVLTVNGDVSVLDVSQNGRALAFLKDSKLYVLAQEDADQPRLVPTELEGVTAAVDPAGSVLATAGKHLEFWQIRNVKMMGRVELPEMPGPDSGTLSVKSVRFDLTGKSLVITFNNGRAVGFDVASLRVLGTTDESLVDLLGVNEICLALRDRAELATSKLLQSAWGPQADAQREFPSRFATTPDGRFCAACNDAGVVEVRDRNSARVVTTFAAQKPAHLPPDYLASGIHGAKSIDFNRRLADGTQVLQGLPAMMTDVLQNQSAITSAASSPTGDLLSLASKDDTIRLWDLSPTRLPADLLGSWIAAYTGGTQADGDTFQLDDREAWLTRREQAAVSLCEALEQSESLDRIAIATALAMLGERSDIAVGVLADGLQSHDAIERMCAQQGLRQFRYSFDAAVPELTARLVAARTIDASDIVVALRRIGPAAALSLADCIAQESGESLKADALHAVGCIGSGTARAFPVALNCLDSPNETVRQTAIETLIRMGPANASRLEAALENGSPETRAAVAEVIGRFGDQAAAQIPALLRAQYSAGDHVSSAVSVAISRIGKPSVPHLINELDQPEVGRRVMACRILGWFGEDAEPAIPNLVRLATQDTQPGVRNQAAEALGHIGQNGVRTLVSEMQNDASEARYNAVAALERLVRKTSYFDEDEIIEKTLVAALSDREEKVRNLAGRVLLGSITGGSMEFKKVGPTVVPVLLAALDADDANVRGDAVQRLRLDFFDQAAVALPKLEGLLDDTAPAVRNEAALALGQLAPGNIRAVQVLINMLQQSDNEIREAAVRSLDNLGGPAKEAVPQLVEMLDDGEWLIRSLAMEAICNIQPDSQIAVQTAMRMLDDPEEYIRGKAASLLGEMGDAADAAVPRLLELLRRGSGQMRYDVSTVLDRFLNRGGDIVPALMELIRDQSSDDTRARGEAVAALGAFGAEAAPAVPLLIELIERQEEESEAAKSLGRIGTEAASAVPALCRLILRNEYQYDESTSAAVNALKQIGENYDAGEAILAAGLDDHNPAKQLAAATGLAAMRRREPMVIKVLISMFDQEGALNEDLRQMAAETLEALGPSAVDALPALTKAVGDVSSYEVRVASLKALVALDPDTSQTLPLLTSALEDEAGSVRVTAAWALVGNVELRDKLISVLIALLEYESPEWNYDEDQRIRCQSAHLLGVMGSAAKEAIPALKHAAQNPNEDLQSAVNTALAKIETAN